MNYEETIQFLKSRDLTMSRYERYDWDKFVKKNNLEIHFPFIHITGTNGKGSTAKYIYEIYQAQGYKVGLFLKPYFYAVNEMISYNGKFISDEDIARIVTKYQDQIERFNLSEFEVEVLIAYEYFNEVKPDVVIVECGMGGETDATNLEKGRPILSIITTISLEHTAFLGTTVTEIAMSKSGIIKQFGTALIGKLPEDAEKFLISDAQKKEVDIHIVDSYHHEYFNGTGYTFDYGAEKYRIRSTAKYMINNATLAIDAVNLLQEKLPTSLDAIKKGLLCDALPGRMEMVGNIFLDGAHCPEAIEAIMDSLSSIAGQKKIHTVFASLRDKNIAIELPRVDKDSENITITTFDNPRARDEMDYFLYLADYEYEQDWKKAIDKNVEAFPEDLVLVTGSLAFVGQARKYVLEKYGK